MINISFFIYIKLYFYFMCIVFYYISLLAVLDIYWLILSVWFTCSIVRTILSKRVQLPYTPYKHPNIVIVSFAWLGTTVQSSYKVIFLKSLLIPYLPLWLFSHFNSEWFCTIQLCVNTDLLSMQFCDINSVSLLLSSWCVVRR